MSSVCYPSASIENGFFSVCYPFAIRLLSVLLSFCEPILLPFFVICSGFSPLENLSFQGFQKNSKRIIFFRYPFANRSRFSTLYWSSIIHAGRDKVFQDDIRLKDVFSRRWYILLLFSIFSMHSCAIWNTWGPIAETAKQVREQYRDGNL